MTTTYAENGPRPLRPKPGVMGGAVPAALKLHPDTRLSSGSAAQLIAGLALDLGATWAVSVVHRLNRPVPHTLRPGPGFGRYPRRDVPHRHPGIRLSRLVLLAVAPVVATVVSVVAAVLAPVASTVDAVGDDHGTSDGCDGPPAASGGKWHVRLLPRHRPRWRPAPLGRECGRWRPDEIGRASCRERG